MNQNHSGFCSCGCNFEKQNTDETSYPVTNKSMENDMYSSDLNSRNMYEQNTDETSYPVTNKSMENDMYSSDLNQLEESISSFAFEWNRLPIESRRFASYQQISAANHVWDHAYQISSSGSPNCYRSAYNRPLVNYPRHMLDHQQFIWFKLDNGSFIIANRHDGRVLRWGGRSDGGADVFSDFWEGLNHQMWQQHLVNNNQFRLSTVGRNIHVCDDRNNSNVKMTATPLNTGPNVLHRFDRNGAPVRPIVFPPRQKSPQVPQLSGLNVRPPGVSERRLVGASFIPTVMISNDFIPLNIRIKNDPYYQVQRYEYWRLLWSDTFFPGQLREERELTGMRETVQRDIRRTLNLGVTADFGLSFSIFTASLGISISAGLDVFESRTEEYMSENERKIEIRNNHNQTIALASYVLTSEYQLIRPSSNTVVGRWEVSNPDIIRRVSYPHNLNLEGMFDKYEIIRGNAYFNY
ncbi:hypothetical protein WAG19_28485 [Bacillus cereus]|uniref:hypothetical protein n=1 Tax=Bacillus cereus TaxID=1396 RepID=UPI003012F412